MTRVAIVLVGGDPIEPHVKDHLPSDAFVIAADSGVHAAPVLGLHVDVIVGDFDSADPRAVDDAIATGTRTERHAAEKDATDLELALDAAIREGAEHICVVGGAGGRFDHLLANISVLTSEKYARARIEAFVGDARITVVRGGDAAAEIVGESDDIVTLIPMGGTARGITTTGLHYPLNDEDLPAGTTRGVSNVLGKRTASVSLREGVLVAVQPWGGRS